MASREEIEQVCGTCCHFKYEGTDGCGQCGKLLESAEFSCVCCSDECSCGCYVSEGFKRHQMAVLRKCQRCLQSNIGTEQALDVEEVCEAIDFLVDYCKLY